MVSLRIAGEMGFEALYMTGFGTVASHLGLPDAGLATYTDMVGRVRQMAGMARTPLIADGDTGYGGLLNVQHTGAGLRAPRARRRSSSRIRRCTQEVRPHRQAGASCRWPTWCARSRWRWQRGVRPTF